MGVGIRQDGIACFDGGTVSGVTAAGHAVNVGIVCVPLVSVVFHALTVAHECDNGKPWECYSLVTRLAGSSGPVLK